MDKRGEISGGRGGGRKKLEKATHGEKNRREERKMTTTDRHSLKTENTKERLNLILKAALEGYLGFLARLDHRFRENRSAWWKKTRLSSPLCFIRSAY